MEKNFTPEERLLNLIRTKNKKEDDAKALDLTKPGLLQKLTKSSIARANFKAFARKEIAKYFSFKTLAIICIPLTFLFSAYILFELFFYKDVRISELSSVSKSEAQEVKLLPQRETQSFNYYSQQIEKRDIFKSKFDEQIAGPKTNSEEMVKGLKIVGIIMDEKPQVIIEDTKDKTTHFLYKGDFLGELKVEDISESKVILSYGNERLELAP